LSFEQFPNCGQKEHEEMMKIVCVNFRCMSNTEVHIKKGIVLLKGDSGKGKTTVLESIIYGLYGTMKGQYTHGCKSCTVSISIDPDIVVQRNSGPASLSLQVGAQKYTGTHAQEIINGIFGSEAIFIAGSYSQQGERCALLTGSNEEKMTLLRAISFRQDNVETAHARIAGALKSLQDNMAATERDFLISQRELDSHRKAHPRIDFSEVNVEELSVDDLNVEMRQIEINIKAIEVRLKKVLQLEAKIGALSGIAGQVSEAPSAADELQLKVELQRLQDVQTRLRDELNTIEVQEKLKKVLQTQLEEIDKLKTLIADISSAHGISDDNAESETNRILEARKGASHFKAALKEFGVTSVGELRGQIGKLGTQMDETKVLIQDVQTDLDAKRWNEAQTSSLACPGCHVSLRYEDNTLKLVNADVKFDPKPVKNPDATEEMLTRLRHELSDCELKRSKIQASISGLVQLSLTVTEETEADAKKLEAIRVRKTNLDKLKTLENATKIEVVPTTGTKEVLMAQLQESSDGLHKLTKELHQLESVRSQCEANSTRLREIETSKVELGSDTSTALESKLSEEKQKLVDTKEMRDMAINIIKTVDLEAQHARNTKALDVANRKFEKLKQMQNLAKQTEISILERSVQVLNEQVNQFLSVMFPDEERMTIKFSTTKETRTGKERMTCSIAIFYKNVHYEGYKQLSRGEGDRVSLAIMLAINSLTDGKFILLDETLNTLDSSSKLRILDMLRTFAGSKKRCIIASHDIVEGSFDTILNF
jgi:DNA repair exonuclease SbcCD ATPase subunit